MKIQADINFIKIFEKRNILTFTNVNLSIKHSNKQAETTYYENIQEAATGGVK